MNQVHGRDVAVVDDPFGDDAPPLDGVVTARRGLALAVLTADCTPVLLADPVAGVAGAAHAGRPGLVAGVVPALVEAMARARAPSRTGSSPAPARRLRPLLRGAGARCGTRSPRPCRRRTPRPAGAPRRSTSRRACGPSSAALGVTTLEQSAVCTLESRDHFSYRREKTTGRLASYVWLEAN